MPKKERPQAPSEQAPKTKVSDCLNTTPSISGGLVHELPADLANALRHSAETLELWESLTPIGRNEFIC